MALRVAGQLVGGPEQKRTIFRIARAIQAKHGELVAGVAGVRGMTFQKVFDGRTERAGDAGNVASELPRAVGFPLGHRAAADVTGASELVLGEAAGAPKGADARADGGLV